MATTIYTISNTNANNVNGNSITSRAEYVPGSSIFYIPYDDLGTNIKSVSGASSSNASIISEVTTDNTDRQIAIKTGTYVALKAPGNSLVSTNFEVNLKYTVTFNDNTTTVMYSKVSFYVEANGSIYSCVMTSLNGTLDPTSYVNYKLARADNGKDDLDSLVTKKGLVVNMKEMARQISNKIGATAALSINYKLNGGHWDDGFEPRSTFVVSTGYTPKPPKRVGYKFDGWRVFPATGNDSIDDSTTAGSLYDNGSSEVAIKVGTAEDITACAKWTPVVYQVKFKNANGSYGSSPFITYGTDTTSTNLAEKAHATSTITGDSATAASAFANPTGITAGYEFTNKYTVLGSNGQEVIYNVGTSLDKIYDLVKSDNEVNGTTIELTPVTSPKVFDLTYNLNTSSSATAADSLPNTASLDSGIVNKYTYDTTFNLPIPVAKGYSFNGWTIGGTSLQNQRVINPTDLSTVNASSVTLTATWVKNSYHFEFDAQGGTLGSTDLVYISPDASYTIADPSKEGYTFSRWTGDDTKVTIGTHNDTAKTTPITVKDNIDTDIILKATWSPAVVKVNVEYWYEDINSSRTQAASTTNTTYNLSAVKALTLGSSALVKTGDSLIVNTSGSNVVITSKHNNTNVGTMTITPEDGFDYVANTVSDNAVIRADGTTVVRLYFARKTVYYKVSDKYNNATIANGGSEGTKTEHIRGGSVNSCLYGQTQVFAAEFDSTNNPEAGYTVDAPSKKARITSTSDTSPDLIEFIYSRKTFTVKFDLNGCGKYDSANIIGDAYSTTAVYNSTITLPTVTEGIGIDSSKWQLNGTDKTATTDTIYGESLYIRVPEFTTYILSIGSNIASFSYNNTAVESTSISNKKVTDFPYYLEKATAGGYNFTEWQYSYSNEVSSWKSLGGSVISEKLLSKVNSTTKTLYIRAIFSEAEPQIIGLPTSIAMEPKKVSFKKTEVSLNNASGLYLAVVNNTSGIGSKMNENDTTYTISTTDAIRIDTKIMVTPFKTSSVTNTILTGKPWIGTISPTFNKYNIKWISTYAISSTDTNTTYSIDSGLMSEEEKRKLALLADGATATAVAQGKITDTTTLSGNNAKKETVEKYEVGTIKVNNTLTTLYGKDTTYGVATNTELGLVKLSSDKTLDSVKDPEVYDATKAYPVQITSDGVMGVVVPWTDEQTLPVTTLVTSTGTTGTTNTTANGTVYVNPVETKGTTPTAKSGIKITGSGGTSVKSDTDGLITINSPSQAPTLNAVLNAEGTLTKNTNDVTLTIGSDSYTVAYGGSLENGTICTDSKTTDGNYGVSFKVSRVSDASKQIYNISNVYILPNNTSPSLVKVPTKNDANKFLKSDGSWDTPTNTQVKYNSKVITSIATGENITTTINSGVLTISGTANTEYTHETGTDGATSVGITVTPPTGSSTKGIIKLNAATSTSIGGIKANVGGSKTIQHTWTNPGTETATTNTNPRNVTVYAPVGSNDGKYYPVETTTDNAAVVCIPNVSHPTAGTGTIGGFKAAGSISGKTIQHINSGTYYSVDIVSSGGNKDQAVVCVPASSGTTVKCDNINVSSIVAGSGINVVNNGGALTINQNIMTSITASSHTTSISSGTTYHGWTLTVGNMGNVTGFYITTENNTSASTGTPEATEAYGSNSYFVIGNSLKLPPNTTWGTRGSYERYYMITPFYFDSSITDHKTYKPVVVRMKYNTEADNSCALVVLK